jgi:hypothetical protein
MNRDGLFVLGFLIIAVAVFVAIAVQPPVTAPGACSHPVGDHPLKGRILQNPIIGPDGKPTCIKPSDAP